MIYKKQAYCFVAILGRINYVTYHPFISVCDLRLKAHMGNRKKADILDNFNMSVSTTLICPSTPVAAARILVSPFGSLRNSFEAYALELVSDL